MNLHETGQNKPERAAVIAVDCGEPDAEQSLYELTQLTQTAGAEIAGVESQKRPKPDAATYIGKGKLQEIKDFCADEDVSLLIFDAELSPAQLRNIEEFTEIRAIDRTQLILDIFASRAFSAEGKIQVELAQLQYSLPRLRGKGVELSRLGGGIGTRGPGESKLESDRRHLRRRIDALKNKLAENEKRRQSDSRRRQKNDIPTVAIVGYTNAGKSTLLNRLTGAGVLSEDKLFATLDPTARRLRLPCGASVILIDTVGFIRRLPTMLVESFKSTLEHIKNSSLILNICDGSSEEAASHLEVTNNILVDLGCVDIPIINVFNKCDITGCQADIMRGEHNSVNISALTGDGIDRLLDMIEKAILI